MLTLQKKLWICTFYLQKRHPRALLNVDDFKEEKLLLISSFLHFTDSIYLDSLECLHYIRPAYYQKRLDNSSPYDKNSVLYVIEEVWRICWCIFWDSLFKLKTEFALSIRPSSSHIIRTDIGFKLPRGYLGKLHPRSSFVLCFTNVGGEVIGTDYRGPVSVIFSIFQTDLLILRRATDFDK